MEKVVMYNVQFAGSNAVVYFKKPAPDGGINLRPYVVHYNLNNGKKVVRTYSNAPQHGDVLATLTDLTNS